MRSPVRLATHLVLLFAICASTLAQVDRITGRTFATRSEVIAQHGMVCTSHPLATQIGLEGLSIGALVPDDTNDYIRARLARVGATKDIFSVDALSMLHEALQAIRVSSGPRANNGLSFIFTARHAVIWSRVAPQSGIELLLTGGDASSGGAAATGRRRYAEPPCTGGGSGSGGTSSKAGAVPRRLGSTKTFSEGSIASSGCHHSTCDSRTTGTIRSRRVRRSAR